MNANRLTPSRVCLLAMLVAVVPASAQEFSGRIELELMLHELPGGEWGSLGSPTGLGVRLEWGEPTRWMHTVVGVQRASAAGNPCPDFLRVPCKEVGRAEASWREYSFGTVFRPWRGDFSPSLGLGVSYLDYRFEIEKDFGRTTLHREGNGSPLYVELGFDGLIGRSWDLGVRIRQRWGTDPVIGRDSDLDSLQWGLYLGYRW